MNAGARLLSGLSPNPHESGGFWCGSSVAATRHPATQEQVTRKTLSLLVLAARSHLDGEQAVVGDVSAKVGR